MARMRTPLRGNGNTGAAAGMTACAAMDRQSGQGAQSPRC